MNQEIREYMEQAPEEGRAYLMQVYEIAKETLPGLDEKIAWRMPSFYDGRTPVFQFAAFKKHIGIYPGPDAIAAFSDRLEPYKTSKGAVQFQYREELPAALIRDMAVWCRENR